MSKLGIRSGKLVRSFGRNSTDSLYNVTYSNGKFSITLGSLLPYAKIQNDGGFIKAIKSKKSKSGRTIYAMESMFWARYYKSKNMFFRIMALAIRKRTTQGKAGVNIKGTKYFDNSVTDLANNILPKEYDNVIRYISDMSKKTEIGKLNALFVDRLRIIANRMPDLFQLAMSENMVNRGKDSTKDSGVNFV
jgi:hypothetical protein